MLTLEETAWSLNVFKVSSALNIFPIGVDVKSGKIGRQPKRIKYFMWKILFGIGISHWLYIFGRLVQSTILEPEKYFRWDHFILHFGLGSTYALFYFIEFCLFVKSPQENMIIFNQLFKQREDPVQKMIDQENYIEKQSKAKLESGSKNANENPVCTAFASGRKTRAKSGLQIVSTSTRELNQEGQNQNEVTENQCESNPESESKAQNEAVENQSESGSEILPRSRPLLTWPPQYSLDELLAKLLPLFAVFAGLCTTLILAVDPTHPQLLFSSLPPEYQNIWSFLTLFTVEAICTTIVNLIGTFIIVAQLLFFGKVQLEFKQMGLQLRNLEDKFQNRSLENGNGGRALEREIWILRQILAEMRELVVFIELFNRCFPFPIFACKMFSLSSSILCYFFTIRYFQDFPFLAAFIGYCATITTLIYTIMYQHAFSIPGKMDQLKNEFLLTAQKTTSKSNAGFNGNKDFKAEMKREIRRIRGVGIKVGSFNQMERESTPKFVDFVFTNVVSLLVTFPRQP